MDELSVRMGSAYYSRAARAAREANQNEFNKVTKILDKWKSISTKNLGKEEERMKRLLNRLEQDKAKYKSEASINPEENAPCPSPTSDVRGPRSFHIIHSKPETESADAEVRGKLFDYECKQGRSRRQLAVSPIKDAFTEPVSSPAATGSPRRYSIGDPLHARSGMALKSESPQGLKERTRRASIAVDRESEDTARRYLSPDRKEHITYLVPHIHSPDEKSASTSHTTLGNKSRTAIMSPVSITASHVGSKTESPSVNLHGSTDSLKHSNVAIRLAKSTTAKQQLQTTEALKSIYDMTIKSVNNADAASFSQKSRKDVSSKSRTHSMDGSKGSIGKMWSGTKLKGDDKILKDLEDLLRDAKQYTNKKNRQMNMNEYSTANRYNKKRIQYLENILSSLKSNEREKHEFDPQSILKCTYLRLSDSNIEHLENELRSMGIDPGIHCHSKNYSTRLFDDREDDKLISTVVVET